MIKVLITDKLAQQGIDLLNSTDGVEAVVKTGISEDELADIIGRHDGLIIRSGTKVTARILANPGKLKAIARAGVGVDNIDIPEATKKGVLVMNTPGGNTVSAAEHTLALMLAMSRNVVPACDSLIFPLIERAAGVCHELGTAMGCLRPPRMAPLSEENQGGVSDSPTQPGRPVAGLR